MPLEASEPRRLYRHVADQLRHLIEDEELTVGARLLPERELSEALGVSRPTVREALADVEGAFEPLRAREFGEAAVVEEACRMAGPADLRRRDAVLDAGDGPDGLTIPLDRALHVAVAAILGNAVIERFVARFSTSASTLRSPRAPLREPALTAHRVGRTPVDPLRARLRRPAGGPRGTVRAPAEF